MGPARLARLLLALSIRDCIAVGLQPPSTAEPAAEPAASPSSAQHTKLHVRPEGWHDTAAAQLDAAHARQSGTRAGPGRRAAALIVVGGAEGLLGGAEVSGAAPQGAVAVRQQAAGRLLSPCSRLWAQGKRALASLEQRTSANDDTGVSMWVYMIGCLVLMFLCGFGTIQYCASRAVSRAVQYGIEEMDMSLLGVEVEMKRMHVNMFKGIIEIQDLIVRNPPGFKTAYLMRAGKVLIDLDLAVLGCSKGREIEIEKAVLRDVTVNVETHLFHGSTNIEVVLEATPEEPAHRTSVPSAAEAHLRKESETKYTLHEVAIQNLGVSLSTAEASGKGMHLLLDDIIYRDFNEEFGKNAGGTIGVILQTLVKGILKTVAAKMHVNQFRRSCAC